MKKTASLILILGVVLLALAGLVSAGGREPLAEPTETVGVFLPYVRAYGTPKPPAPDAKITELQFETRDEWVTLTNEGTLPQDMTDWRIHSVVGDQWYTFPSGFTLAERASVRVHSGPDAVDNPTADLMWETKYLWNNAGDKAILYDDQGVEVDSSCYGNGCP